MNTNLANGHPYIQAITFVEKYTPNEVCPEFCKIVNDKDNLRLMGKFPFLFSCLIATTYLVALIALTVFGVLPVPEFVLVIAGSFPVFLFTFAILYAKSNHNKTYFVLVKSKGRIEFFDLVSQSVSTASIVPESVFVESKLGRDELGDFGSNCRVNVRRTDGETICILKSSSDWLCDKVARLVKEQANGT